MQPLLFHELMAEMSEQFPVTPLEGPDLEFNDEPWRQLPTMQELEQLWLVAAAVDIMIAQLATKVHGGGEDLPKYLAQQRWLADVEVQLIRSREAENAAKQATTDIGGPANPPPGASAHTAGGGGDLPGGPENGVAVGKGRKTRSKTNGGRAPAVSGR